MASASGRVPWSIRHRLDDRETPGGAWEAGYTIGKHAELGDQLPHPTAWTHDYVFYQALRAGLRPRGMDASMFMVVTEARPLPRTA